MKKALVAAAFLIAVVPLHADLRQQIESKSGWVGYEIHVSNHHTVCWRDGSSDSASSTLYVLYRVSNGSIDTIRVSSPSCDDQVDPQWLRNVEPRASAQLLRKLIDENSSLSKKAVTAFALHDGTVDELIDIARHHPSSNVRGMALFWVSQAAGQRAASVLKDAAENDPEEDVKGKAVFGISQLPNDQSIPLLISLLKTNQSRNVRKKAAFWLGQKDDPRALAALEDILKQ
jgi:HEAT repeat protein